MSSTNSALLREAVVLSVLLVAYVVVLRVFTGQYWMAFPLTAMAIALLIAARRVRRWSIHARSLFCLGGISYSIIFAFDNIRSDQIKFWLTLEQVSILATAGLSACYWFVPSGRRSVDDGRQSTPSREWVLIGTILLMIGGLLPSILKWVGSPYTQKQLEVVLIQQVFIWAGVIVFAINSYLQYRLDWVDESLNVGSTSSRRGSAGAAALSSTQKSWILFFCSDFIAAIVFTILGLYVAHYFGWSPSLTTWEANSDKGGALMVEGALAFFTGAVTFQVLFSNGVFYFVSLPYRED